MGDDVRSQLPSFVALVRHTDCNSDCLKIPPQFRTMHMQGDGAKRATIKVDGIKHVIWKVEVMRSDDELVLKIGWPRFLADNLRGPAMFFQFSYEGRLSFKVSRYDDFGVLMMGPPCSSRHLRNIGSLCLGLRPSFMSYIDGDHNSTRLRIPDAVAPYFRDSRFPMVFLSVQHKPMLAWGVQLRISPIGAVWFTQGWDRFIEDNNVTSLKFLLFEFRSLPNLRVLIYDGDEDTFMGVPCAVDNGVCSAYGRLDDEMVGESRDDNILVGTTNGENRTNANADVDIIRPQCICKINHYSAHLSTSFVRTNLRDVGRSDMTLINGDGIETVVTAIPCKGTLILSAGFNGFRLRNNLSVGDKCKFVLVGYKTLFVTKVIDADQM